MNDSRIWFPAKTHGWGWGLPVAWQSWAVLAGDVAAMVALPFAFHPERRPVPYFAGVALATLALLAICWARGERPRWRWGGD